jgi:hypothetical protein
MTNPLLRLTQTVDGNRLRTEMSLEVPGQARQIASCAFNFKLSDQDNEDIRWYLEDYLNFPVDPAPQIASRIEQRMSKIGVELFNAIFHANEDARDLWATLREKLADTRVEIISTSRGGIVVLPLFLLLFLSLFLLETLDGAQQRLKSQKSSYYPFSTYPVAITRPGTNHYALVLF